MDGRPIGIFDSGLGGMTAAKVLEELLPGEDLIYFGDSGRMPYGGRTLEELRHFARTDAAFLLSHGVKAILVACGTISSNAMGYLRESFDLPFFGVVESACRAAAERSEGRVGIIATQASIKSGAYEKGVKARNGGLEVISRACPSLVPLVESGHFLPGDPLAEEAVRRELRDIRDADVDTLILGCTHFPLLEEIISGFVGSNVRLVSAGAEAAGDLAAHLREQGLLSGKSGGGTRRYFTSGDRAFFAATAAHFLGHPVEPETYIAE
ncbi:MAG: glutamate racemase [Oscillospiraceae bacterium]